MKRRVYFFSLLVTVVVFIVAGAATSKSKIGQIPIRTIPDSWSGVWEVTVDYRDGTTGALVATDVTTSEICPGEPIIPPELNAIARCADEVTDSVMGVACHNFQKFAEPSCNSFSSIEFSSKRKGDSWNGKGKWSANLSAKCIQPKYTETFVVTGRRISRNASCDRAASSLVQKFFLHSRIVPFLQGGN